MQITSSPMAASAATLYRTASPEAAEGPGPDKVNDHDADDGAAAASAPPVKAAPPKGMGQMVDITA